MYVFDEISNERLHLQNNKYLLTNISHLNREVDYNEYVKIFKFFNINNLSENNENQKIVSEEKKRKKQKKREKIDHFLRDTAEKTEILINFLSNLNKDKSIFYLKNLRELKVNESEKRENQTINYLKKVDFLDKSIKIFNNKLSLMKENKDISQLIFRELLNFKRNGFLVEENYKFPEIVETLSTKLIFKNCFILENLLGKKILEKKFSMNLTYKNLEPKHKEENSNHKHFQLNYDFYEKFKKKKKLEFLLILKIFNKKLVYNLGQILDDWIEVYFSNILDDSVKKYAMINYLKFIYKYICYKIFKLEIRNISKIIGNNFYENKQFSYYLDRNSTYLSINSSYYDILEVNLMMMKIKENSNLQKHLRDDYIIIPVTNSHLISNKNQNVGYNVNPTYSKMKGNEYLTGNSSFTNSTRQGFTQCNYNMNSRNYFHQVQNLDVVSNTNQNNLRNNLFNNFNINTNYNRANGSNIGNNNQVNHSNIYNSNLSFQNQNFLNNYNSFKINPNNNINLDDQTKSSISSTEENKATEKEAESKYEISNDLICYFVLNIFNELKSFKSIREFYYKLYMKNCENANMPNINSNQRFNFFEIYDATIFNFNLNKLNQIVLRKFVICHIDEIINKRFLSITKIPNLNFLSGNYSYRFTILNNLLNIKLRNCEFSLVFQKNKTNFDFSITNKNSILITEKESNQEIFNKRIDFNLLFEKLEKFLELNQ